MNKEVVARLQEVREVERGTIRRSGSATTIGTWTADTGGISVTTEDADLREAADSVLSTPQVIPVHAAERFEFVGVADTVVRAPSAIQFLALFALEMEARGFELLPDEE
jgi:hypothetical protein